MNIVDTIDKFDINNVYFSDGLENTVMDNSIFSKIIYSTNELTLNSIYILCSFKSTLIDKISPNKFKVSWNPSQNNELINSISKIEYNILNKYGNKKHKPQLATLLSYNNFRIFSEDSKLKSSGDFLLRISGIWDSADECGITYKFLEISGV